MPTKPVITPFIFATDALYTTGPAPLIGTATKIAMPVAERDEGWKADQTPPAQWFNHNFNHVTQWTNWVALGSASPDEDAHIVESSASGLVSVARLAVTPTTAGPVASIQGVAASTAAALDVDQDALGQVAILANAEDTYAIDATNVSGTDAAIRGVAGGSGEGGHFTSGSSGLAPGVRGVAGAAGAAGVLGTAAGAGGSGVTGVGAVGNSHGGFFTGFGISPGVEGTGGDNGIGVIGTGGATSGAGGQFVGRATQPGTRCTGGLTNGTGCLGISGGTGGIGVEGQSTAAATSTASAVRGLTSTGDATAVEANSSNGDGYAVRAFADTSSPVRAAMRIVPQDADPSSPVEGDFTFINDGADDVQMKVYREGAWRGIFESNGGFFRMFGSSDANQNNATNVYASALTVTPAAPYDAKQTGLVIIRVSFECGHSTTGSDFEWRLRDTINGADIIGDTIEEIHVTSASEGDTRYVTRTIGYNLLAGYPGPGGFNATLQFRRVAAGTARIRRMSIEAWGVF